MFSSRRGENWLGVATGLRLSSLAALRRRLRVRRPPVWKPSSLSSESEDPACLRAAVADSNSISSDGEAGLVQEAASHDPDGPASPSAGFVPPVSTSRASGAADMTLGFVPLVRKFERSGSVSDFLKSRKPKISDVQVAEVLQKNQNIVNTNPLAISSANAISKRLQKPYTTAWKILRKILKMYPYILQLLFQLKEADFAIRYDFSLRILAQMEIEPKRLSRSLWIDEAHLSFNGGVNSQTCRIWLTENPDEIIQEDLHNKKVTVWCCLTANFIVGSYFSEEIQNGDAVSATVTG
ncbi:hypothetical protein ILUMI_17776 [Ignelater luminosus]|uniref:Uncharacterized protein n=1 Tax=Ignelater luminosus TaxID=2038154 RepID=A0A8K0CQE9_IGNLU|nr:hypothetical protein ILUMI_17776 [Ignelater luminosus]